MKAVDFSHTNTRISQRNFILGLTDMAIQGLLVVAVFLMLTGFLYLIK